MQNIVDNAERVEIEFGVSVLRTKSRGGNFDAQKRGPTLYNCALTFTSHLRNGEAHLGIEKDIRASQYGAIPASVKFDEKYTGLRGSGAGAPLVSGASQSGLSIDIDGFASNRTKILEDGDFIQFAGKTKVYQVVGDYDSNGTGDAVVSGTSDTGVVLNSPIPTGDSPADGASVILGKDVSFQMALFELGTITYSSGELVEISNFRLEEVL